MKLCLKNIFEGFFDPELPSQANRHKVRSSMKNYGPPTFPFTDPKADEKMEDSPALGSSGVPENELEEAALFNTEPIEPPTNVTDIAYSRLKGGLDPRRMNTRDLSSNLSIKDFYDDEKNQNRIDNQAAENEVKVRNVQEAIGEKYKFPTDMITTKDGFKNGLPTGHEPWRQETDEEDLLDGYMENPGYITSVNEWQSDQYERMAAGKKVKNAKSDLAFLDDMDGTDHPFLMVSMKDFKKNGDDDEE